MIKVGFIDYYLDEWHANTAPEHLEKLSNGEVKVCYAYGEIANAVSGVISEEWCQKTEQSIVKPQNSLWKNLTL